MGIDDNAVRELGLDLRRSPTSTELRLPRRIGLANAFGLGFFGLIVLLLWGGAVWIAWTGPQRSIGLIVVASAIAIALLLVLRPVTRWLRYGADVTVTPDLLVVKHHWTSGERSARFHLHQVQLEEGRREIVVAGSRLKTRIGSGLDPEARRTVVEFLSGAIAGYLHPGAETSGTASGAVAVAADAASPADPTATSVVSTIEAGPATTRNPIGEPWESEAPDVLMLALCQRLRDVQAGQVYLLPGVPPGVLVTALRTYLDLQDDEVLLGFVGASKQGTPGLGCALTTRRIYWPGKGAPPGSRLPRCRSAEYRSLPEMIGPAGLGGTVIDLGEQRQLGTVASQPVREALVTFLWAARALARGESPPRRIQEAEVGAARQAWPRVAAADRATRSLRGDLQTFESRTFVATRARVTPAILLACVAVFAAMVAQGMPILKPDGARMLDWGANFGPSVVFDHQVWRLFTCMFLHFGLFHLALNMYCLATAGPLVERFFGHLGFAGLYLLSGLGGSIASLCFLSTSVSAGASGAIFGIFGGLLGFLAIRHRDVPPAMLKPMRGGALAFVGYNTIFGLSIPGIDMAAHLGGLVTGFFCGLALTAAAPAGSRPASGLVSTLRRAAVLVVLSALLAGLGLKGVDIARNRILADPEMARDLAAQSWNKFSAAVQPVFGEFGRIEAGINGLTLVLSLGKPPDATAARTLAGLKGDCQGLVTRIANLPAENAEIQEIRKHLAAAQAFQLQMLTSIEQFLATRDRKYLDGLHGASSPIEGYTQEFQTLKMLMDAYFQAHGIERVPQVP